MRAVFYSDIATATRAVLAVPHQSRACFCARLLREADWADRFTRRLGKPHPQWGNGTLLGAARGYVLAPERLFDETEYRRAFALVISQLDAVKGGGDL